MKEPRRYQQHLIYLEEIIIQIAKRVGRTDDTERVLEMVEAVLRAIRRRLAFPRAIQFLMLLPLSLQALFVERWVVSEFLPPPLETFPDLIDDILAANPALFAPGAEGRIAAEQIVAAIMETIADHTSPEAFHQLTQLLPETIQEHLH